jgi:predicted O-methyltransferase YrrM
MITRDPDWNVRLQCEFWLTMAAGRFHNIGVQYLDLYQTIRWSQDAAFVIDGLLDSLSGSRYLEIVSGDPSPYRDRVDAATKDVITLAPEADVWATLPTTTDHEDAYDVVFIDTWHDPEQCLDVIEWSLRRLRVLGAIVVHDTDPPTAWHGRPPAEFEPGTEWNGPVWQAIVRFRLAHPEIDVRTVDTDWGCTVIRPWVQARERVLVDPDALTWESFSTDRALLLNLMSVSRFRRDLCATAFSIGRVAITDRTDVINGLVAEFGYERYLEVGLGSGDNFERIIAPVRQSVDPEGAPTFRMTSDEFFTTDVGCPRYDLIFIDAFHEEDASLRDIEHSLGRLEPGGCIVVHDTNPPTEWHQRPYAEFVAGSEWNGTVWKAIIRFRERHPGVAVTTLDVDWGCTIIRAGPPPRPIASRHRTLEWRTLDAHRDDLLNLVPPTWGWLTRTG